MWGYSSFAFVVVEKYLVIVVVVVAAAAMEAEHTLRRVVVHTIHEREPQHI